MTCMVLYVARQFVFRERIVHLEGKPHFHLHYADLGDSMSIIQVMNKVRPTKYTTWRSKSCAGKFRFP